MRPSAAFGSIPTSSTLFLRHPIFALSLSLQQFLKRERDRSCAPSASFTVSLFGDRGSIITRRRRVSIRYGSGSDLAGVDMALNRAQMLVRDSEALAQFRVDHRIPDDVVIERPGPNDNADWVEGEGSPSADLCEFCLNRAGVTDSPDKDQYLNDFIWVSGQWEFLADGPDPFSVPRHRGYVPRRSDRCSAAISAVNNCGCSRRVSDLLGYVPLYQYTIPLRAARQGRSILPPLQICGPGSRPRSSLSDEVSDLFEGTSAELRRLLEEAEGESSGSNESSSSSWDIDLGNEALNEDAEVEDGKEVDQVPAAVPLVPAPLVPGPEPINLPSSDSDVAIVEPREIVEHSYSHSGSSSSGSQLNAEIMASKVRILGKKQGPVIEPPTLPEAPVSSTPAPAEDQSIAPSLMGGKRKGKLRACSIIFYKLT
ncbi:hypothetical protein Acr_00g0049530 [Actinidia rufa]|uniref:Uncharacterized protein n=1 Tax=Actinidia rufa TaxID=165716 RepID=A0A7J0DM80_9ERIC|nr:hypothetical protein Acr_00g0049530 [Actinidia rufa]